MRTFKLTRKFLNNDKGTIFTLYYWEGKGCYFHIPDPLNEGHKIEYWVSRYDQSSITIPSLFKEVHKTRTNKHSNDKKEGSN